MNILEFPNKKLNKKKIIIASIICAFLFAFIVLTIIYFFNFSFREFIDIYIFRKKINSDNLSVIEINSNEDYFFHSYDKYIAILNKNILYSYNSAGQISGKNDVTISNPLFANNNKYLVVAEKDGNNLYLISGTNVVYQKTLDLSISQVTVNKNGYVSIIFSGSNYKSIVSVFDTNGSELFKTYLSNNIAISTNISNDNKYLSIGEINYSGSVIESIVRNISIETAKNDPTNSVISTYNFEDNILLSNIKYCDKNTLLCYCSNGIYSYDLSASIATKIFEFSDIYEFVDINAKNSILYTYNSLQGFSNTSFINIKNIFDESSKEYHFKGSIKSININNEKIAINTGNEIHFIGLNGWLIKKYESYYEINNILIGDSIAGIIYKNKIEIIEI